MESSAGVSRYVNQNSMKRVFLGGGSSSSSAGCKDLEGLDMSPPPSDFISAKPRSSKEEEVLNHEIIDMEENSGLPKASAKGKELLQDFPLGNDDFMDDIFLISNTGGDDFSSSPFDEEDGWADSYHDEMLYNDYSVWESQFDHMNIPTGVEVQLPWFPGSSENDPKVTETSSSAPSNVQPQPDAGNSSTVLNLAEIPLKKVQKFHLHALSSSLMGGKISELNVTHKKFGGDWGYASPSSQASKAFRDLKFAKFNARGKNKRNFRSMNSLYGSHLNHSPPVSDMPTIAHGAGNYKHSWNALSYDMLGSGGFQLAADNFNNQKCASFVETNGGHVSSEPRNVEEIVANYFSFKRFETVEDFSDHRYCSNGYSTDQPPKNWARKIQEEWRILENDLPENIYVRAYEARMDLLRAVIIGAEGTPYHDGLFFFDICFPKTYPNVPPLVYYHSGGLRINPNLYNCGKVCLSLLNTWSGGQKEKWIPGESTMLQVLVSIQGLILNAEPFFNEPGYDNMKGTPCGEMRSLSYNESTFMYSLQTMVYKIRNPPKYFEDFVLGHFITFARDILTACKAYLDGARVARPEAKEGGDKSSQRFKANLVGFLSVLVPTFLQIGAKDCEEFIGLAMREGSESNEGTARAPPPHCPTK